MIDDCARQVHIIPTDDIVQHDTRYWNGCLCGPEVTVHKHPQNGLMHWDAVVTHHSLDGREAHEQQLS